MVVKDRSFVRGSVVPFEEDLQHEFKGHRTISIQDRLLFLSTLVAILNDYILRAVQFSSILTINSTSFQAASRSEAPPQGQSRRTGEHKATVVKIHLWDDQLRAWRSLVRGHLRQWGGERVHDVALPASPCGSSSAGSSSTLPTSRST